LERRIFLNRNIVVEPVSGNSTTFIVLERLVEHHAIWRAEFLWAFGEHLSLQLQGFDRFGEHAKYVSYAHQLSKPKCVDHHHCRGVSLPIALVHTHSQLLTVRLR
jgi:hypothetical protein